MEDLAKEHHKWLSDDYKREVIEKMSISQLVDTVGVIKSRGVSVCCALAATVAVLCSLKGCDPRGRCADVPLATGGHDGCVTGAGSECLLCSLVLWVCA